MPAHYLVTRHSAGSACIDVPVTIPIGNGSCLSQRFSPTGFNPNAPDLRRSTRVVAPDFRLRGRFADTGEERVNARTRGADSMSAPSVTARQEQGGRALLLSLDSHGYLFDSEGLHQFQKIFSFQAQHLGC